MTARQMDQDKAVRLARPGWGRSAGNRPRDLHTAKYYNREMRNIHLKSGDQVRLGPDTISHAGTASPVCCRCLFWHHWLCSARSRIYTVSTAAKDLNAHSQAAAPTIRRTASTWIGLYWGWHWQMQMRRCDALIGRGGAKAW